MKTLQFNIKGNYFVLAISMGHQGLDYSLTEKAVGESEYKVADEFTDLNTEEDCVSSVEDCDALYDLGVKTGDIAALWKSQARGKI